MWMMTPRGFYSAVQKRGDGPDMLTVRARDKKDLENLSDLLPDAKPYQTKGYSDYPWRIRVTTADWARVCAILAMEINYSNFKDEVKKRQGAKRASVYSQIWSVLLDLEPRDSWQRRLLDTDLSLFDIPPGQNDIDRRARMDETARAARHRPAGTKTKPKRKPAQKKERQSKPQRGGRR